MISYTSARIAIITLLLATLALAGWLGAPSTSAKQPVITYISLKEGDVYTEPLPSIQICFAEPIDITDLGDGGDFDFKVVAPGFQLGLRIVFQLNGYGVTVYPGFTPADPNGDWTFAYRVIEPATRDALTGEVKYKVDASGQPVPKATPPDCLVGGVTQTPGPTGSATPVRSTTPTPATSRSVTPSPGPSITGPTASPAPPTNGDDGGRDILELALFTIGAAGGAALIALAGYMVRRRIGFWLHKPPPEDTPPDDEHH